VVHEEGVLVQKKIILKMIEKIRQMRIKSLKMIQNQMIHEIRIKILDLELVKSQKNQIEK
jgi:hypothetical protein